MIERTRLQTDGRYSRVWRGRSITLALVALAIAVGLTAPDLRLAPSVVAAEVDAIGVPAPTGFADIVARVKPAVVRVRVTIEAATPSGTPGESLLSPGSPLNRFFHDLGIPVPRSPVPQSGIALGSGFFISGDGYVVTNNHVVENGTSFEVTTDAGRTYQAQVIGTDPQTDLALIKVSGTDFPYVRLAADMPRIGDWVLAVGNPFGLGGTVTAGIVSARGRDIGAGPYEDFIQIDAPVNKGNSGGPSFDTRGEVIGVNTAIYSPSGGSVGIAFDIPAQTVRLVIDQLKDKGYVTRGWIGVQIQAVTPEIADAIGLKNPQGAMVAEVQADSPAAKAGIESGDVITSVNGEPVADERELARKIAAIAPGTAAKFGIFRKGEEQTVTVTLGELPRKPAAAKPEEQKPTTETPVLGLTVVPARNIPGAGNQGVVITRISPTGIAAESGLQAGDIILEVDGHAVNSSEDARKLVDEARKESKRAILLRIKRDNNVSFVGVRIA